MNLPLAPSREAIAKLVPSIRLCELAFAILSSNSLCVLLSHICALLMFHVILSARDCKRLSFFDCHHGEVCNAVLKIVNTELEVQRNNKMA